MLDSYSLVPQNGQSFPISVIKTKLSTISKIAYLHRIGDVDRYLVGRSKQHVDNLVSSINSSPDAPYPYVGIIDLSEKKIDVAQETTEDILEVVQEFVVWLSQVCSFQIFDREQNQIVANPNNRFSELFD